MSGKPQPWPQRFWARVAVGAADECWEWLGSRSPKGYGECGYKRRTQRAHRVSYFIQHGIWPKPMCLHRCDNPGCVNPAHLYAGSARQNTADMMARGRNSPPPRNDLRGERNHASKLTTQQVQDIRANYALCRVTQQELADRYGVSNSHVSNIINFNTRKDL